MNSNWHERALFILVVLVWGQFWNVPSALSFQVTPRNEISGGIEANILWLLPPFKTYEIRVFFGLSPQVEMHLGFGRQEWSYDGKLMNAGDMHSNGLVAGIRYFVKQSPVFVDYAIWLMMDRFESRSSGIQYGTAVSHEFFSGYRIGKGTGYVSPGLNLGFYSSRGYAKPLDDRFKLTVIPKAVVGYEFK